MSRRKTSRLALSQPAQHAAPVPRTARASIHKTRWNWKIDTALALGAALFVAVVWCVVMDRLNAANWQVPISYGLKGWDGDTPGLMANLKAFKDGHLWPLMPKQIPDLNAPFAASWDDFPLVEQLLYFSTGVLGRFFGLFPAANLMVMILFVLAAVGFFVAARLLQVDRSWAAVGAILFALSPYAFSRQLHHLQVLSYWHIPLCLVAIYAVWAAPRDRIFSRSFWFAAAIGVVSASLHPYYTNLYLQFICIAAAIHLMRGNWRGVLAGAGVVGVTMAVFLLLCLNVFIARFTDGPNPEGLQREFRWLELSALKPLDMLLPTVNHTFEPFSELSKKYLSGVAVLGEIPPGSYLGIVTLFCVAWLAFFTIKGLITTPAFRVPKESWMTLWIVLYAIIGGVNCLGGIGGILFFRSSNRYSIFIAAIVMLWAGQRLSRTRFHPGLVCLGAGALLGLGLWDQIPGVKNSVDPKFPLAPIRLAQDTARTAQVVNSDRTLVEAMEKALPAGAMVFQMPVMDFPESPIQGVGSYEHFRPYLHSTRLRFSFGTTKGRARETWQKRILEKPIPEIVADLEKYGFGAIYVHRGGFEDRGEALRGALAAAGRDQIIESPLRDLYVVLLKPSSQPVLPE